jgi:TM2 domain-containing membrane protein YozV
MRGSVLEYNAAKGVGIISGQDGKRYSFKGTEFRGDVLAIRPGQDVDFEIDDYGMAAGVYPLPGFGAGSIASGGKSKVAAGVLAILLGALGIHKFYLGYTGAGIVMLLCGTIGWLIFFPGMIICVIAIVEGVIYLTKTDAEFEQIYVVNQKPWF